MTTVDSKDGLQMRRYVSVAAPCARTGLLVGAQDTPCVAARRCKPAFHLVGVLCDALRKRLLQVVLWKPLLERPRLLVTTHSQH